MKEKNSNESGCKRNERMNKKGKVIEKKNKQDVKILKSNKKMTLIGCNAFQKTCVSFIIITVHIHGS